jgi:putative cell wall-binding protein
MQARGVTDALILGGASAITDVQEAALESAFPGNVERLSGSDRYATGVEVATYGVDTAGLAWNGLALSTGQNFPDALAGGVLAGKNGSVMLLTKSTSLPGSVSDKLTAERDWIADVYYLGGEGAISQDVRDAVVMILH